MVRYSKPPVVEVVFGVLFATPPQFVSAHVGSFWSKVRSEFPRIEEVAPLTPIIEQSDAQGIQLEFHELPPMRRSWLISADGQRLLQVQHDRFLYNWKRETTDTPYPSFEKIRPEFERYLKHFGETLRGEKVDDLAFRQYELTYINVIGKAEGLVDGQQFQALADHRRDEDRKRFLPTPHGFNWHTIYSLPDNLGRLHVTAATALRTAKREPVIKLELTARGMAADGSEKARMNWFDVAHDWITNGFADVTCEKLQVSWGRQS